ncbi:hypothetical protein Hamer_G031782, partial [Homarus americanus]
MYVTSLLGLFIVLASSGVAKAASPSGAYIITTPWGGSVQVVDGQNANVTQAQLSWVVDEARRLRQVSWCDGGGGERRPEAFSSLAELFVKGRPWCGRRGFSLSPALSPRAA